jgi:hypothetical protein
MRSKSCRPRARPGAAKPLAQTVPAAITTCRLSRQECGLERGGRRAARSIRPVRSDWRADVVICSQRASLCSTPSANGRCATTRAGRDSIPDGHHERGAVAGCVPKAVAIDGPTANGRWAVWSRRSSAVCDLRATRGQHLESEVGCALPARTGGGRTSDRLRLLPVVWKRARGRGGRDCSSRRRASGIIPDRVTSGMGSGCRRSVVSPRASIRGLRGRPE